MVVGFDYTGWLVVFVLGLCVIPFTVVMYMRERRGPRRPTEMARWRGGILGALFITFLTGLRRFVFHQ